MQLLWDWQGASREEGDAEVGLSKYIVYLSKDVLMKPGTMNSECILLKESQTNKTEKNTVIIEKSEKSTPIQYGWYLLSTFRVHNLSQ